MKKYLVIVGVILSLVTVELLINGRGMEFLLHLTKDSKTPLMKNSAVIRRMTLPENMAKKFSPTDDGQALGIGLYMERSEIENILGKPQQIDAIYDDAFGKDVLYYHYEFGIVGLDPLGSKNEYTVSSIRIDRLNYQGPRNIQVGDSVDAVLAKFPLEQATLDTATGRHYIYGSLEADEQGYIIYDEWNEVAELVFTSGGGGFGTVILQIEVENNTVIGISLKVNNI